MSSHVSASAPDATIVDGLPRRYAAAMARPARLRLSIDANSGTKPLALGRRIGHDRRRHLLVRVGSQTTAVGLAAADVRCGPRGRTLVAAVGSALALRLRGSGAGGLPSAQLRALAGAVSHGRAPAASQSGDDPVVVAQQLRDLAGSQRRAWT